MNEYSIPELEVLRDRIVSKIVDGRRVLRIVTPHNNNLKLLVIKQIGHLLLSLDLLDATIAEKSNVLITPYWIPKK